MVTGKALAFGAIVALYSPGVSAESFDQHVEALVRPLANGLSNIIFYKVMLLGQPFPLIVLWLAVAAVFFTLYLGFINIRGFGLAIRHLRGHYHNPEANGEISHFQAVATAISGTVGIGNIGGVAVAIVIGGPGAAFWLFIAGFMPCLPSWSSAPWGSSIGATMPMAQYPVTPCTIWSATWLCARCYLVSVPGTNPGHGFRRPARPQRVVYLAWSDPPGTERLILSPESGIARYTQEIFRL